MKHIVTFFLFFISFVTLATQESYATSCTFSVTLSENDYIYADTISISVNHPAITLGAHTTSLQPIEVYDLLFKENKLVLSGTISFTIPLIIHTYPYKHAHVYIRYYQKSQKKFIEHFLPITIKPPEVHATTISLEKNKKTQPVLHRKKGRTLFPTWWDDISAICIFLLEKYRELILIWWIFIGLLLFFTPLISPTLTLATQTILQKETILPFFHYAAYALFHFLLIIISCNTFIQVVPYLQNNPLWYLHTLYSCALVVAAVFLLGWHTFLIAFLQRKHILITSKELSAFLFLSWAQTICLYPVAYFIVSYTHIYYALLTLQVTISIPFYAALKWHGNTQFVKNIQQWSQETTIALGYTLIYATIFIWYYTGNVTNLLRLLLTACLSASIGIWYIIHAKSIQTFWRYITRIIGMTLCASSLLTGFYWYKLQYPIEKAPRALVLKK